MTQPRVLIMAGGTGGHIFPGLALARALRREGWSVHWLGAPDSMESRLVPEQGVPLETVVFGGVRGKGLGTRLLAPWRLLRATWTAIGVLRRVQPDVVLGMGGYITMPGGVAAVLLGVPLLLHEQNSVAGLANRLLAKVADQVFTAFPKVMFGAQWVGNPLRSEFLRQPDPLDRFAGRTGRLKLLVMGGSLGATALNTVVPQALALLPPHQQMDVVHQSGEKHFEALQAQYAAAGVSARLTPFIQHPAQAYADADLVLCRAGASTVAELAAVGAAALFVPFPSAVDDHQTYNARFLVEQGAAWMVPQSELTPAALAERLGKLHRADLVQLAVAARRVRQPNAVAAIVAACKEYVV